MTEPTDGTGRRIYTNRTLNLRALRAIGYDMDYTLIHYRVKEWESLAYRYVKERLLKRGWPVESMEFEPDRFIRGLMIDTELGNIVKANRFGYPKRATHGTRVLGFDELRSAYARQMVELSDPRFRFLNTLFSLSEACWFSQLVDCLDEGQLSGVRDYRDLSHLLRFEVDEAHVEGRLKAEIVAHPEKFVELDPDTALALLDQKRAGKKLMLITNSEWSYTQAMMQYAFDPFLTGMTWQALFDLIIVDAQKPAFFTATNPIYEVVSAEGLLRTVRRPVELGKVYQGGHVALIEEGLGCSGDDILYVGDHLFGDVQVSKRIQRWRTALVLRELEHEVEEVSSFYDAQKTLEALMGEKEAMEQQSAQLRLKLQRIQGGYGPRASQSEEELRDEMAALRDRLQHLDVQIAPLAKAVGTISNPYWGQLMRTGNDKSQLARQVERYADVYMSRVSNFLGPTPFAYLRSSRGSLPHDPLIGDP
jgi:5'-nucleotidase